MAKPVRLFSTSVWNNRNSINSKPSVLFLWIGGNKYNDLLEHLRIRGENVYKPWHIISAWEMLAVVITNYCISIKPWYLD